LYIYKDFGHAGTTFFEALTAPFEAEDCGFSSGKKGKGGMNKGGKNKSGEGKGGKNKSGEGNSGKGKGGEGDEEGGEDEIDCKVLVHSELENCVLTPISSFEELLTIQSIIPAHKAAYTAVYKDRFLLKEQLNECKPSSMDVDMADTVAVRAVHDNCEVENWMLALTYGKETDEPGMGPKKLERLLPVDTTVCETLKEQWINYGTDVPVPECVWIRDQPSYCGRGPIQNIGAVWAVDPNGNNYADLRDVSANWPLPGAVYKCCKDLTACFLPEPVPTPTKSPVAT
jgi:hypothetical protein